MGGNSVKYRHLVEKSAEQCYFKCKQFSEDIPRFTLRFFLRGHGKEVNVMAKMVTAGGSWGYSPQDYPIAFAFLRHAGGCELPMGERITHHFLLEKIGEARETHVPMNGIKVAVVVE